MQRKLISVLMTAVLIFGCAFSTSTFGTIKSSAAVTTALELNKTDVSIYKGMSFQLTATKTPSNSTDAITWTTSNKSIATVTGKGSKATVKTIKTGTTYITCKSGKKTVKCKVTVRSYLIAGETWTVKGQWQFKIDSVKKHTFCNEFSDKNDSAECVIVTYSYKNIGYKGAASGLYFSDYNFNVMDSQGEIASRYNCYKVKYPQSCVITGSKCTNAQVAYALTNKSSYLTIVPTRYTDKTYKYDPKSITFKVKVS